MDFKSIETPNLIIRRMNHGDVAALSAYRSQPEVAKYQSWDTYSREKASELIQETVISDPANLGRWFQFGLELKENGELVGDIGFCHKDESGHCWIGFTLDSNYWGRGLATEAVGAVVEFYQNLGVNEVRASVDPGNHASKKLLTRLGFALVSEEPDDHIFLKKL